MKSRAKTIENAYNMGISIISIYSLNVENQYCKYYSLIINLHIFLQRTLNCLKFNVAFCFDFSVIECKKSYTTNGY